MLQIINYQDEIFGLYNPETCGKLDLKIGETEFTLHARSEITLTSIPEVIFQKIVKHASVSHYINGDNTLTVDAYKDEYRRLRSFMTEDDDGNDIWETREDKNAFDVFTSSWKPVYSEPSVEWVPIEFDVVMKERVPEKYQKYITSSTIVVSEGSGASRADKYKSVCTYQSSAYQVLVQAANALGFEIVGKNEKSDGMKIEIGWSGTDCLRFSKVNNDYISIPEAFRKRIGMQHKGTLEYCIQEFESEYKVIYEYLEGLANTIQNRKVSESERADLLKTVEACISNYHSVETMKSTRDKYRWLGESLNQLKRKITMQA